MKKLIVITILWIVLYILTVIFVMLLPEEYTGILNKHKEEPEYQVEICQPIMVYEIPEYLFDDPEIVMTNEVEIATPSSAIEEPAKATLLVDEVIMVFMPSGPHLTMQSGTFNGPSGKETYYNLDMSRCVSIMRSIGFSEEEYPYWVRSDGAKMLGDYVMCAAELNTRPRGTVLKTSMGEAIVCDTGSFAYSNPYQIDIAVNW